MTHPPLLPRLLAGALLITLAGVATAAPPTNPPLRDTRWALQALDGTPQPAAADGAAAHLVFDAKSQQLRGHGGCNLLQGRFTQRGTQLALSPVSTTRRACPAGHMQQEQRLLQVLAATDAYRIEGPQLSLLQGDAVRATFQAIPSVRK